MKRAVLWIGLCLLSLTAHAGPQINVGVVYDYLEGERSSYLKRVFNGGTSTAFVKVNVLEIVYNEDGTSKEVPVGSQVDDKGVTTNRDGLMASPARLIVPVNGRQGTRLLYMGARDKERYFRLRFIPVVPEKDDNFGISSEEQAEYKDDLAAGINVMTGYGTVFFVRPRTPASIPRSMKPRMSTDCATPVTVWWCWTSFMTVRRAMPPTACRLPSTTSCRDAS